MNRDRETEAWSRQRRRDDRLACSPIIGPALRKSSYAPRRQRWTLGDWAWFVLGCAFLSALGLMFLYAVPGMGTGK